MIEFCGVYLAALEEFAEGKVVVGEAFLVEVFHAVGVECGWKQFGQLRRKHH